ncbi:hypothetical protein [Pseudonocardia xinjiangensis]|uniref:Uncharacterized protein n=1 Tax=Pseudonocardia xinjiangensis TaxID=75289 RepID=A0ABX1RJ36_9PSEU|nr:hypothetical protein [Pseudonocardia xinjiangensis]NMH79634.1 hypothetical protein [Pseudonocardia xinjiangensis]
MTAQQQPPGKGGEPEERLPPEVQGDGEMGQDPTTVPAPGAPSMPMEQPDEPEAGPRDRTDG